MKFRFAKTLALGASSLALAGGALAATDGEIAEDGAASSGTSDVQIIKQVSVQVTLLDDLDLGTFARLDEAATATDDICVFSSGVTYFVTVDSANGAFALAGANSGDTIPYSVSFNGEALTFGTQIGTAQTGTDTTCDGDGNAAYTVSVDPADFNAASYDTYTDTLTVSVVPE